MLIKFNEEVGTVVLAFPLQNHENEDQLQYCSSTCFSILFIAYNSYLVCYSLFQLFIYVNMVDNYFSNLYVIYYIMIIILLLAGYTASTIHCGKLYYVFSTECSHDAVVIRMSLVMFTR